MNLKIDEVLQAWVWFLVTVLVVSVSAQLYLQYGQPEAISLLVVGYLFGVLLQYWECQRDYSHRFTRRQALWIALANPIIMVFVVVAGTLFFVFLHDEDTVESAITRLQNIV